ncbi:MAG: PadR family transcriptional regulator [Anaerolineae bacterium]
MPWGGKRRGRGYGPKRRWGRRIRIVEPMMLLLLAEEPTHGYRLVERLAERYGIENLPPQTVYRILQEMEERGWVSSDWDLEGAQGPPKKVYRLEPAGRAALDAWSGEIEELRSMLGSFLSDHAHIRLNTTEEAETR